ncbi:MAG: phenylalanine--tRNA ligase subunit beta [Desulfovibrio sp.]|nr:MAG: phenylalanine--tRNA ligase subunit beta [Desulfovibrio sp.]
MLLSLNWLKEMVDFQGSVQELADRLTMVGLEIEEIIHPFEHLDGVVVGHVLECSQHPQADKLSLCSVDVGEDEPLPIVCGAPNVAQGQKVAVAKVGTELGEDFVIKKAKLRGEVSMGMICAEDELGLGEDHAGIMILDSNLAVGTPITEALNLDTVVFDVGVTPNRTDCLSVLGLAREVAIAFDLPLTLPTFEAQGEGPDASEQIAIEIPEPELCPVYQGRIIENIEIKTSPAWMRYRLIAVGQRPINNIVDTTNYVMFELGQPLHAFDLDLIEGGKIRVARAEEGSTFTTLDNHERKLTSEDLLIWDGKKPVGLAGVMGGANSEIHDQSRHVLLEAAVFRPLSVRKTSKRLALPSEAAYRLERGVDQPGSLIAINRASQLIAELGGGRLRTGVAKGEPLPWKNRIIAFRPARATFLLGVDLSEEFCRKTLTNMGCHIDESSGETWQVTAPSWRLDLEREVDIIEELGRMYGMDRIEPTLPRIAVPIGRGEDEHSQYYFWKRVKVWARGAGLSEAVNYSFVGDTDLDHLGLPREERIPVMNPLSEDQNVLRTMLAPGLLNTLRHNLAQGNDRLRIVELAHVFWADSRSETTAQEPSRLGLLLHGGRHGDSWPHPQEDADYLDLKGLVEHLMDFLQLDGLEFALAEENHWLAPRVEVSLAGQSLGYLGRVKPEIADRHHARKPVWISELDLDLLKDEYAKQVIAFSDLPKFPPSRRDITVIAPQGLPVGDVLACIRSQTIKILESVFLADVFIPPMNDGQEPVRNLTFRLTFRHGTRTLKDKEVDKEMANVAKALKKALPVTM